MADNLWTYANRAAEMQAAKDLKAKRDAETQRKMDEAAKRVDDARNQNIPVWNR
jgi:hypothetical protein